MLFILDRKQEVVGVANSSSPYAMPYFDDLHVETLAGVDTYTFKVPADHEMSDKIVVNGHVVFTDLDGDQRMYTIKEVSDGYMDFNKQVKEVFCENTAISELLSDVVRPFSASQVDMETLVNTILSSANQGWEAGLIEYYTTQSFAIKEHMSVLEALRYMVDEVFFKELYFTVELRGTKIIKKKINIVEQRGQETGIHFEYGINLRGVSRTENTDNLATALVGLGKADNNGVRLTLTTSPAFDDGDFYKDPGTDWIGSEVAYQIFNTGGGHLFGIHIDDEADTVEKLLRSTKNELKYRCVPLVIYSASIENLERFTGYEATKLRLGDRIVISDTTYSDPIVISGRVMELERSYLDPTQDKVDLGRYKKLTTGVPAEVLRIQTMLKQNEEKWNQSAEVYRTEILSTGGDVFKNGIGTTTLRARLFKADIEIDAMGTDYLYKWYQYDKNGSIVPGFGGTADHRTGKEITVFASDVNVKSTFVVEVELLGGE